MGCIALLHQARAKSWFNEAMGLDLCERLAIRLQGAQVKPHRWVSGGQVLNQPLKKLLYEIRNESHAR